MSVTGSTRMASILLIPDSMKIKRISLVGFLTIGTAKKHSQVLSSSSSVKRGPRDYSGISPNMEKP